MQRITEFCIASSGTMTSEINPGSQYAASSRITTDPPTPFRVCEGVHV